VGPRTVVSRYTDCEIPATLTNGNKHKVKTYRKGGRKNGRKIRKKKTLKGKHEVKLTRKWEE
jgi:tRNA G37 N-methylase TrmD